jgi:hypothetical protein
MTKHDTIQHAMPGEIARSQALFEAIDGLTQPVLDRALDKLDLGPEAREHFFQEIADCSKVIGKITCARVVKITTDRFGMVFVTVTDGATTFIFGPAAFSPAQIDELKRAQSDGLWVDVFLYDKAVEGGSGASVSVLDKRRKKKLF